VTDNVKFIIEADGRRAEATLDGLAASIDKATSSTKKLNSAQDSSANKAKVAGNEFTTAASKATSGFSAAAKTIAAVGGAIGALKLAEKLVEVARSFDVINASLVTVTGTQAAADKAFAQIQQFAATTPFALEQVSNAFVKLKALGLDPSERALQSYGNTASAMGKDLNQMIEAVADASTGEFERLKEFGIKASQQGDKVSFTFRGVTTTVAKESGAIQEYLLNIGETDFAGAMERRAASLDGALSNLGDSWDNLFLTISKAGVGKLMAEGARDASTVLAELAQWIQDNTVLFGQFADGVANAARGIALPFQVVGDALGGVAAQLSFISEGEFAKARDAGNEALTSIKQRLDDVTDPQTATKYADMAKRIIEENKKMAASAQETTTGVAAPEAKQPEVSAKAKETADRELKIQEQKYAALTSLADTFYSSDQQKADMAYAEKSAKLNEQYQALYVSS